MDFVTIYEDADFGGTGIFLDVGDYRLFGASDMNDTISSIQVPAGLVAMVFEHADSGGGYGISADFLEDCADLAPLGLNDKISYISVFRAERDIVSRNHATGETGTAHVVWERGSVVNGQYVPGHWERKRVVEPPPNTLVTVSPPIPPHTGGIAVHASVRRRSRRRACTPCSCTVRMIRTSSTAPDGSIHRSPAPSRPSPWAGTG